MKEVEVGQKAILRVTLLVPTWFPKPPEFPIKPQSETDPRMATDDRRRSEQHRPDFDKIEDQQTCLNALLWLAAAGDVEDVRVVLREAPERSLLRVVPAPQRQKHVHSLR